MKVSLKRILKKTKAKISKIMSYIHSKMKRSETMDEFYVKEKFLICYPKEEKKRFKIQF